MEYSLLKSIIKKIISTVKAFQEYKSFNSLRMLPYVMPAIKSIDIDTELDLIVAESVINMQKK